MEPVGKRAHSDEEEEVEEMEEEADEEEAEEEEAEEKSANSSESERAGEEPHVSPQRSTGAVAAAGASNAKRVPEPIRYVQLPASAQPNPLASMLPSNISMPPWYSKDSRTSRRGRGRGKRVNIFEAVVLQSMSQGLLSSESSSNSFVKTEGESSFAPVRSPAPASSGARKSDSATAAALGSDRLPRFNIFICPIDGCVAMFNTPEAAFAHVPCHYPDGINVFTCRWPGCATKANLGSLDAVMRHTESTHKHGRKFVYGICCSKENAKKGSCERVFSSFFDLDLHVTTEHEEAENGRRRRKSRPSVGAPAAPTAASSIVSSPAAKQKVEVSATLLRSPVYTMSQPKNAEPHSQPKKSPASGVQAKQRAHTAELIKVKQEPKQAYVFHTYTDAPPPLVKPDKILWADEAADFQGRSSGTGAGARRGRRGSMQAKSELPSACIVCFESADKHLQCVRCSSMCHRKCASAFKDTGSPAMRKIGQHRICASCFEIQESAQPTAAATFDVMSVLPSSFHFEIDDEDILNIRCADYKSTPWTLGQLH